MNAQLVSNPAARLLSRLTGQNLEISDITPQLVFITNLLALLKGIIHADGRSTQEEIAQFQQTLNRLNLNARSNTDLVKVLLSGIQKNQLYTDTDNFLIVLELLSESEKLLLFGLGYKMAMADSSIDEVESQYLRTLGTRLRIELRYLDVLEATFKGKNYNLADLQELCKSIAPARFQHLDPVIVDMADCLHEVMESVSKAAETEVKLQPTTKTSPISTGSEYQHLQEFQNQKRSLIERVNRLCELIDDGIDENLLPITFKDNVLALKKRLESQRFRVAAIGEFSQGKSTLLNALVGQEIQPVRAIPCSGAVSVLRYGERQRVICRYQDGSEEEIAVEQYREKASISKVAALNNRGEALLESKIQEIIFEHPNLSICRNGVEIVDSPGLNEHPERTKITQQLLAETDAIVFLTHANKLLTQKEVEQLEDIQKNVGAGDKPLDNLFLVVNFIDHLDTDEDRQDTRLRADNIMQRLLEGSDRIHLISAKLALKATLNGTSDEYLTGFQAFTRALEMFLTAERGNIEIQNATREINKLTQACLDELNIAANNVTTNFDPSYKQEILERIGEASGRFITINKMAISLNDKTTTSALASWAQYKKGLKAELIQRSKKWQTVHNPIFSRDKLIQDYISQFSETLQQLISDWALNKLNPQIISLDLEVLDKVIKQELEALDGSFANLERRFGTTVWHKLKPAFNDFNTNYVTGFAASGFIAGGGAAAAAFFLIPALALAPAIIIGVISAALLGGGGLTLGMADAYYQIANKVCELGFEELEKTDDSFQKKLKDFVNIPFTNRVNSVKQLIKQIICDCENRMELEERKQQENIDQLLCLISSKKQDFEKLLSR